MVETPPTPIDEREAIAVEFTAGFRHLRTTHGLARLTVLLAVAFGFAGMANTAIFALVEEGLGRSPAFLAVIARAIEGLGSIGGGITAAMPSGVSVNA